MPSFPPRSVRLAAAASVMLAGCSTVTPIVVRAPGQPDQAGDAITTLYTGSLTTERGGCRGTYTGAIGDGTVPLAVDCNTGVHGTGVATLAGGRLVRGEVRLAGGGTLTVRSTGPAFP